MLLGILSLGIVKLGIPSLGIPLLGILSLGIPPLYRIHMPPWHVHSLIREKVKISDLVRTSRLLRTSPPNPPDTSMVWCLPPNGAVVVDAAMIRADVSGVHGRQDPSSTWQSRLQQVPRF
jgi:hypothetical protein